MVNVQCVTNLDGYSNTSWPVAAAGVPNIGDGFQSIDGKKVLYVVAVTHCWDGRIQHPYVKVELNRK
jgi:hypothetical protein